MASIVCIMQFLQSLMLVIRQIWFYQRTVATIDTMVHFQLKFVIDFAEPWAYAISMQDLTDAVLFSSLSCSILNRHIKQQQGVL